MISPNPSLNFISEKGEGLGRLDIILHDAKELVILVLYLGWSFSIFGI